MGYTSSFLGRLQRQLFEPASVFPLVALRIAFGFTMFSWSVLMMLSGRVSEIYAPQKIQIPYVGLEWLQPLPVAGMLLVFVIMALSALALGAGYRYRLSTGLFFVLFAYVAFIDRASYLSYYYFVLLLCLMLWVSPAHRMFSFDLLRKPDIRVDYTPGWLLMAFKIQVVMVFFFAGMAKLNSDWLYSGSQMTRWLQDILGGSGEFIGRNTWIPVGLSWLLVLFDFIMPHFLLDPRTSHRAFWVVVMVQLAGMMFLPTGIFPLLVVLSCTVFLPGTLVHNFFSRIAYFLYDIFQFRSEVFTPGETLMLQFRSRMIFPVLVMAFLGIQILIPVGMYLNMGSIRWASTAFHFSWDMRLHESPHLLEFYSKDVSTGAVAKIETGSLISRHQQEQMAQDLSLLKGFISQLKSREELGLNRPEIQIEAVRCLPDAPDSAACETFTLATLGDATE